MRRWIHVAAMAASWTVAASAQAAPVAEVVAIKGAAVLVSAGRSTALSVGTPLEEGQEVRSMNPGRVKLRFVDGSVVVIGDASTLRIETFRPPAGNTPRQAGFVLDTGLISQTVAPSALGSWTVRTSSVVTAVRGTQYLIEVKADQTTEVSVQSGAVAVEPTPALRSRRARIRGMSGGSNAVNEAVPDPLLLNRANAGTECTADGECSASRTWSPERLKQAADRLSGV